MGEDKNGGYLPAIVCVLFFFGLGIVFGLFALDDVNRGKPRDDAYLPEGTHQIVEIIEVESDYVLLLVESGNDPLYYKINAESVLHEDISTASTATEVIRVDSDNDLKYIEFK